VILVESNPNKMCAVYFEVPFDAVRHPDPCRVLVASFFAILIGMMRDTDGEIYHCNNLL
jgi:hypothetical protein